jgi:hypothetical protein
LLFSEEGSNSCELINSLLYPSANIDPPLKVSHPRTARKIQAFVVGHIAYHMPVFISENILKFFSRIFQLLFKFLTLGRRDFRAVTQCPFLADVMSQKSLIHSLWLHTFYVFKKRKLRKVNSFSVLTLPLVVSQQISSG